MRFIALKVDDWTLILYTNRATHILLFLGQSDFNLHCSSMSENILHCKTMVTFANILYYIYFFASVWESVAECIAVGLYVFSF